ncbi:ABC transporter substrate-binding protein [Synechococcus sp. PCC 7336]|uniref:ABC transporter substrate-binding protein n=1 Tax=Synechococcus sp. PCC 7336 TaxID=195250 RepID=UPI0003799239|nr:ABC transporter substrate-binding protein [Synechococcus sp. PCC 7336]
MIARLTPILAAIAIAPPRLRSASVLLVVAGLSLSACTPAPNTPAAGTETLSVAVTQIVEHPALDAARDGIRDELAASGYVIGDTLQWTWESAQGSPTTAVQIASKFVGDEPDVIVAIATPSAQAAVAAAREIPVIFSAVTDPVGASLVDSLEIPGGHATGVTDLTPIGSQLDLLLEIVPTAQTVGVIFNAGEDNSASLVKLMEAEAPERGLDIVKATVARSSDVAAAAESLVGRSDAIYVPTDNTVISAFESVVLVGRENQLPVFAGDTDSVARGAIAALGFDYYDVGRQTGAIVVRVLEGEDPGTIAVQSIDRLELAIDLEAAAAMGVDIPAAVLARADAIMREAE